MIGLFEMFRELRYLSALVCSLSSLYGAQAAWSEAPNSSADRIALELSIPLGVQPRDALTAKREYEAKIDNCMLRVTVKEERDSFCRSTISFSRTAEVTSIVDLSAISRVEFLDDPRGLTSLVFLLRRGYSWAENPIHSETSSSCGGDVSELARVSRAPAISYPSSFSKSAEQLLNEYIQTECRDK